MKYNKSNKTNSDCRICGRRFNSLKGLSRHLQNSHNYKPENYYKLFFKKTEDEGKCLNCGNKTTFISLLHGYTKCCCRSCSSAFVQERNKEYNLKTYGVPYYIQSDECRRKSSETYLERTGYKNPSNNPKVVEKRKKTYFEKTGYTNPAYNPTTIEKSKATNLRKRGVEYAMQDPLVKNKASETYFKKTGYTNPSKNPKVKKQKQKSCLKHFGYKTPLECPNIFKGMLKSNEDKYGVKFPTKLPEVREKTENTLLKSTGYKCNFQNPNIMSKVEQERFEKTGYRNPSQNPDIRKKMFNFKNGSRSEKLFKQKLKKYPIEFKQQLFIKNESFGHHFDFAIFKNRKLKCLIEIDGELCHGLKTDCNGDRIRGDKDYLRWELVPNKVKFLVIDSQRLEEGFKELLRILPMKYKDWKKEMLRSIPRNIEDAIPKFSEKRMLYDWKRLCELAYNKNAFLGKSILLNFCKSRILENLSNDWKAIRKNLYKSPCSEHHLLEGFNIFKNVSKLREKFRKKYKGVKEVIVKCHSPEKMLAICSLGRAYISKEPIDKDSVKIIKFLNLKAFETIKRIK